MNKSIVDRAVPEKFIQKVNDFEDWFSQIEVCFRVAGWPEDYVKYIMKTLLPQSGDDAIKSATDTETENLSGLKTLLGEIYVKPRVSDAAHAALEKYVRDTGESVQEYAARIKLLITRAHPGMPQEIKELEQIHHSQKGLPKELRRIITIMQKTTWLIQLFLSVMVSCLV